MRARMVSACVFFGGNAGAFPPRPRADGSRDVNESIVDPVPVPQSERGISRLALA